MFVPTQAHPFELVVLMERAPFLSGSTTYKGSRWHGHTGIVLRNGRDDEILTFAGPSEWKNKPTNPIQAIVWNAWKIGRGEVTEDHGRTWDCCHVFPLARDNFYKAYSKTIDFYGKNYQIVGFNADNCVGFTRGIIEAAGIKTSALMKAIPWPFTVRRFIQSHNKL